MAKTNSNIKDDITKSLEPFANALGKAVGQVWKIFVMRYVAKGISELFLAGFFGIAGYKLLQPYNHLFLWILVLVVGVLVYDAIQLLVNPYYFAMDDVAMRLKNDNIFKN